MIRELKSLAQLRALVLAELGKHTEFRQITPELSSLREPDATGCNWEVSRWVGPSDLPEAATPKLAALAAPLQKRYKAIIVRRQEGIADCVLAHCAQGN